MSIRLEAEAQAALRAVAGAEELLASPVDRAVVATKGSRRDVVTALDLQLERHITAALAGVGGPVVGEEAWSASATPPKPEESHWLVDPIDGTVNFVNGLPYYAISVGLAVGSDFRVGAVSLPAFKELYFTYGDEAAFLNGRRLEVKPANLDDALVGASFPGRSTGDRDRAYRQFGRVNDRTRGCVRLGSAAAMICLVAAGRLQAVYGTAAKRWDIAGAIAVAARAGCEIQMTPRAAWTDLDYVVAAPGLGAPLRDLLASEPSTEETT